MGCPYETFGQLSSSLVDEFWSAWHLPGPRTGGSDGKKESVLIAVARFWIHCLSKCGFNFLNDVLDDSTDIIRNVTRVLWTLANEIAHDRHVCLKYRELMVIDGALDVDCVGCYLKQDIFYTLFVFSKVQETTSWSAVGNLGEKFPVWLSTCCYSRFIHQVTDEISKGVRSFFP